jgi:hypothetical protein
MNRRLCSVFQKAVQSHIGGGYYLLDGYNQQVLNDGICFTVTTRTFGDNNHFLLEVYEENSPSAAGNEAGVH